MKINLCPFPFSAHPRNFSNFPTSQRQTSKFCLYLWLPLLSWRINLEVTRTSGLEGCANIYRRGDETNRRDQMKRNYCLLHSPVSLLFPFLPSTHCCNPLFANILSTSLNIFTDVGKFSSPTLPFYFHHGSFLASTISFLFLVLQFSQI